MKIVLVKIWNTWSFRYTLNQSRSRISLKFTFTAVTRSDSTITEGWWNQEVWTVALNVRHTSYEFAEFRSPDCQSHSIDRIMNFLEKVREVQGHA